MLIGGQKIDLIGAFQQRADGSFAAKRKELEGLGLRVPSSYGSDDDVPLGALPDVQFRFDEKAQTIDFKVADLARIPKDYSVRTEAPKPTTAGYSNYGAVLNYTLFGAAGRDRAAGWQYQGASATFDARAFGPLGVISQSGIVTSNSIIGREAQALRLETAWTYSDVSSLITYRAGDMLSGSLPWTRAIRMGGFQMQRNFGIRPDLVTLPLPNVSGSAAVPSTVDVYVNNVHTASQDVSSGPFRLSNIPIIGGNGTARIVTRDASGNTTETSLPFYVTADLLREGLLDFSAEVGYPRLFYGTYSDVYSSKLSGSASARYGLTNWLTLQGHAEGTSGFANAGGGVAFAAGNLALFNVAGSGSWREGSFGGQVYGGQVYASVQSNIWNVSFYASTQRTFGDYQDLASVTAQPFKFPNLPVPPVFGPSYQPGLLPSSLTSILPPRALDRISIGIPVPALSGSINLSYVHLQRALGDTSHIVSATYSRPLKYNGTFFATAFTDLNKRDNLSVFAGISFPLGADLLGDRLGAYDALSRDVTVSAGVNSNKDGTTIGFDVTKPLRPEAGSYGYRIRDVEGDSKQAQRAVGLGYRGDHGQISGTVMQNSNGVYGTGQIEGSFVLAGGGFFFGNRIDDAFAVVDAGAPGVDVLFDNRPVARTGQDGKALVTALRAYQNNKVSIDPKNLPINASIAQTQEFIAPPDRAGVVVDFGVKAETQSAIVILNGRDGKPLQAGLRGKTAQGDEFIIGYDGRAYVSNLQPSNTATVELEQGSCRAEFPFAAQGNTQLSIGPIPCQ